MKIFFGVYNYYQKPTGFVDANKHKFYETFIEGLKSAGHEVLCVDCVWGSKKAIPNALISKLQTFGPDLCILANFGFWSLYDYVDCPVCYMDIDSIDGISMATIYKIRNNISKCYFIAHNKLVFQEIKEKFNAPDDHILQINLFVNTVFEPQDNKGDVIYFGDNHVKNGYDFLTRVNSVADEQEQYEAGIVFNDYKNDPNRSAQDIYDEHKFYSYHRVELLPNNACLNDIFGLEKIKLLSKLSSLDLTIKGYGWYNNAINYYPELISCSANSKDFEIDLYSETLSKYKIALVLSDSNLCKGDILRLLDAAASGACVLVQNCEKYAATIDALKLISFTTIDEAYDICCKLLEDNDMRLSNIKAVHEKLKEYYNVQNAIKVIEDRFLFEDVIIAGGSLEIIAESDLVPEATVVSTLNRPNIIANNTADMAEHVAEPRIKVLAKKVWNRIALFFGYDLKNVFPKEALKIWKFIVWEKLHYTNTIDRTYLLSLPMFEVRHEKDGNHLHLAFFTQIFENIKKFFKFFGKKQVKKNSQIYPVLRKKLKKGEKIKICLFVSRISCWIYTNLYKYLENSGIFDPIIVVKPFMFNGHEAMIEYMNTTYNTLKSRGYNVIKGYDETTGEFLDVKKVINPDIVFYTKYWRPQFHENFYIDKFENKLTFYTSYCFDIAYHPEVMNFELNNKVDRYFMPTPIHKEMAEVAMTNHGENVYVVGAPKLDVFFDKTYVPQDVWKPQEKRKKRIIWAPHHSDNFPGNLYQFNAFYELTDFMFEMAEKYKDEIQIAFKPHPMLKPYLVNKKWGKESAEAYYEKWANLENGQLETGEFIDLFLTSDAMILDSISFIAEYTATNKPSLFTIGATSRVKLNDFGAINFNVLYHTENDLKADIEKFIVDVVINGNDTKKEERTEFVNKYLLPPNGKSSAENIYDNILDEIQNGDKKK